MNAVLNHILRNMDPIDNSIYAITVQQAKTYKIYKKTNVSLLLMALSLILTTVQLQMQGKEIEELHKEIEEVKQTKGD